MLSRIIAQTSPRAVKRLWLISDLQQSVPEQAEDCMTRAVADFLALGMPVDAVCYLGDSVEGHDLARIHRMTAMQIRELAKIPAPVYYAPGNHDFDYFRHVRPERMVIPFIEEVSRHPQWHVAPSITDMAFTADFGDFAVVFLPDHAAPDGSWFTSHGVIRGDSEAYPYTCDDWRDLAAAIGRMGKPVITMSHYNLPGGNREAPLYGYLLPLPENPRSPEDTAPHGSLEDPQESNHSNHIGDAAWAGVNCHRKLCGVDGHTVVQANVASLECYRGSAIRSAFLEYYDDGSAGILFRNHSLLRWDDCYFTSPKGGAYVPTP